MFLFRSSRNAVCSLDHTDEKAHSPVMTRDSHKTSRSPPRSTLEHATADQDDLTRPQKSAVTKPVTIPTKHDSRSTKPRRPSEQLLRPQKTDRSSCPAHNDSLSPSVAALLAVTAIPARRSLKRKIPAPKRRISIDELVQTWRSEAQHIPSYGSHRSMEMLLEPTDDLFGRGADASASFPDTPISSRSPSADSVPSLDLDGQSEVSITNPPTPNNHRISRASSVVASSRKARARSSIPVEDCAEDHPLIPRPTFSDDEHDRAYALFVTPQNKSLDRRKTSFKSNLTLSLQNLKFRALSSLSQLSLNNAGPQLSNTPYAYSEATLWERPYVFPRLSPEVRPVPFSGTPTKSERRYFNPTVLSFEEQQARYRRALHTSLPSTPWSATSLDEHRGSPMIQMQTYRRSPSSPPNAKRGARTALRTGQDVTGGGGGGGGGVDPATARMGPPLVRQREPRENADFLRVVVLEMNMRRVGKLEDSTGGRARIWLPPRQNVVVAAEGKEDTASAAEEEEEEDDDVAGSGEVDGDGVGGGAVEGKEKESKRTRRMTRQVPRRWVAVGVDD